MLLGSVYRVGVLKESTEGKGQPLPPEAQKALIDWIKAIATKAVDGDQEAIKLLSDPKALQQYFQEMVKAAEQQQGGQQPVTEAFEKMRANLGAKFTGGDPIEKRYNLFLSDINGHLWEISQDSRFLNVDPQNVKDFISTISNIEPQVKQQSKLLQSIGYGIGKSLGRTAFVIPIVAGLMYAAPLVGLGGISTIAFQAIAGAVGGTGALAKVLNNKQMTKYEKVMEIVSTAVKAATLAGLFVPEPTNLPGDITTDTQFDPNYEPPDLPKPEGNPTGGLEDYDPLTPKQTGLDTQEPVIPSGRDLPDPDWGDDIKGPSFPKSGSGLDSEFGKGTFRFPDNSGPSGEFPELHDTVADKLSNLDSAKQAVADLLRSKGLTGSSGGMKDIASPTIMNAMDKAGINTTGEYKSVLKGLAKLSKETLQSMQQDPNAAIRILKKLK